MSDGCSISRPDSSPWKGEVARGDDPASADRTGVSRPPPHPRRPTLSSPPWKGAGGMTRRPPRAPAPDPLPTAPLKGGRREEKGGGEKAAAVRLPVRRRGRSRVLPAALLPPGRGEVGRGDDPGSAGRTGGFRPLPHPRRPPSLLPPGRGAGGMTRRPPRVPAPDPPPDLPPERGEERKEGGGEKAEAVGARHTRLRFARPASTSGFRKTSSTSSRSPIRPQSRE